MMSPRCARARTLPNAADNVPIPPTPQEKQKDTHMTDQTGNDRYAGTRPQSAQSQSQGQSQSQSHGQSPRQSPDQPVQQPASAGSPQTRQAGGPQYEVNTPDRMPHDEDQAKRRQQAGEQSDHDPDRKGTGNGAQDDEETADAPEASERGYGGATQAREEKLDDAN